MKLSEMKQVNSTSQAPGHQPQGWERSVFTQQWRQRDQGLPGCKQRTGPLWPSLQDPCLASGSPPRPYPNQLWPGQGAQCVKCGRKRVSMDEWTPLSSAGAPGGTQVRHPERHLAWGQAVSGSCGFHSDCNVLSHDSSRPQPGSPTARGKGRPSWTWCYSHRRERGTFLPNPQPSHARACLWSPGAAGRARQPPPSGSPAR